MEIHDKRQIYEGCISLMNELTKSFVDYLEYIGEDIQELSKDDENALFRGFSNFEIINRLFLNHTCNGGGTSTRQLCNDMDLDYTKTVWFGIEDIINEQYQRNDNSTI